jgi:hypothetical protein
VNYSSIPVKNAQPLILGESFVPRGSTALLDAIGKTIEELKTDRDVVFVIITDGEENSSKTYKRKAINTMIENLQKEEDWKFLFLAANQDAIKSGSSLGIKADNSITYAATADGAYNIFSTVSSNMASYRSAKTMYTSTSNVIQDFNEKKFAESLKFTDEQREDQKKKGAK